MRNIKKGLMLLVCVLLAFSSSMSVSAGSVINVLDRTSFENELDIAQWHNANGDVYVEKGCVVFPENSTADTRLIWKSIATDSGVYEELLSAETEMQFLSLPEGESFILAFGLRTIEAFSGEAGNVEIVFRNNSGITVTVIAYDADGNAVEILKETKVTSLLKQKLSIHLEVTVTGVFDLTINGKKHCSGAQLPVKGSGRMGFLQTGSCKVLVSDLNFKTYDYDSPQNANVDENFNDGTFNANLLKVNLTRAAYYPATAGVCDYNNEKALRFQNALDAYISTVYTYSNFELSFDVLYTKKTNDVDEKGNLIVRRTDNFLVRYGCDVNEYSHINWDTSTYGGQIIIGNGSNINHSNNPELGWVKAESHPFGEAENEGRGYSLRFTFIDNVLTAQIKWLDEKEYTTVFVSDVNESVTPSGFIQIIGHDCANIVFDNIKITNKDENAALTEVEYKSNVFRDVPDYEYEQQAVKYLAEEKEAIFNWYLIPVVTLGVCVIAIGVTTVVSVIHKKKKAQKTVKVGDFHEKE